MSFTIKSTLKIKNATSQARTAVVAAVDPFIKYVTGLFKGTSVNNGTNAAFVDSGVNSLAVTRLGAATQGTFSPYLDNYSALFNGSTDALIAGIPSNWTFLHNGSTSWTVECWFFTNSTSLQTVFSTSATSTQPGIIIELNNGSARSVSFHIYNGSTQATFDSAGAVWNLGVWNHLALTFDSSTKTGKTYINGTQVQTATNSGYSYSATAPSFALAVGRYQNATPGDYYAGYISNFRVTNGSVLYTGTFTPSATKLQSTGATALLTLQQNRFTDGSSSPLGIALAGTPKISAFSPFSPSAGYSASTNGGSMYVTDSTTYLTVPNTASLAFGTGDYTAECWFYPGSTKQSRLFSAGIVGGNFFGFLTDTTGKVYANRIGFTDISTTNTISSSAWSHIAVTRQSNTTTIWVNGTNWAQTSLSTNLGAPATSYYIGSDTTNTVNGYISDLRICTGTALYTASFNPPSSPIPSSANNSLSLRFSNGNVLDFSEKNDLLLASTLKTTSSLAKYEASSLYFDGTINGYIDIPNSANQQLGSNDFTVEQWVRHTTLTSAWQNQQRYVGSWGASGNYGWLFGSENLNGAGSGNGAAIVFNYTTNGSTISLVRTATTPLVTGSWQHIAAVRSGSNLSIYLNGTSVASGTISGAIYSSTSVLRIGRDNDTANNPTAYLNGNIDSLRITNGFARYTASFTPPTAAFPTQ